MTRGSRTAQTIAWVVWSSVATGSQAASGPRDRTGEEGGAHMGGALDPTGGTTCPRVLLVEDDQGNRRRIRDLLLSEGIEVVGEASNGAAGVQLAGEARPDVVLMDLRMPVMGGLEATREIKDR